MFIAERLAYIDLQKTGSTHIQKLLGRLIEGREVGCHYQPSGELIESSLMVVGSIRNPWSWYVSLWAFGCSGQGGVYDSLTMPKGRIRGRGWRRYGLSALRFLANDARRDREVWLERYSDSDDPERFRRWLTALLADPLPVTDFRLADWSLLRDVGGLMTYRYLTLYCGYRGWNRTGAFGSRDELRRYLAANCYLDAVIRTEQLESDLVDVVRAAGYSVSESDVERLQRGEKSNTSKRRDEVGYYYDEKTKGLVERREHVLIEKYGYQFPIS